MRVCGVRTGREGWNGGKDGDGDGVDGEKSIYCTTRGMLVRMERCLLLLVAACGSCRWREGVE